MFFFFSFFREPAKKKSIQSLPPSLRTPLISKSGDSKGLPVHFQPYQSHPLTWILIEHIPRLPLHPFKAPSPAPGRRFFPNFHPDPLAKWQEKIADAVKICPATKVDTPVHPIIRLSLPVLIEHQLTLPFSSILVTGPHSQIHCFNKGNWSAFFRLFVGPA
ncbi:hypothetical protein BABINDRAFT_135263 [Babjeviella inositovora NRRL Y-12698]|uniref:Uncharacterized protein n=1 Tax=Babjeviella inositovora NRRL Y-12698 TaxID=984486 RepID=A0A1E3QQ29_9ASCO|nr:uncharacterized protein BABINDRAFT_135263 [Babjeviella inositovora NRRL Y-12698]ODQ79748.1 hypothetical protein BABINDRAFT_135263 [Babjeviella inositovora NRRL Y-12698]